MKTSVKAILPVLLAALILMFSDCRRKDIDLGIPPAIELKTGGNYISSSDTVKSGDLLLFGLTCNTNGSRDKLSNLVVRIAVNGGKFETRKYTEIPEAQNTEYSEDIYFKLVTPGKQEIKFVITNTHGLQSEKSLIFTVLE